MMFEGFRRWALAGTLVAACGGKSPAPQAYGASPATAANGGTVEPALEPQVASQQWYRAQTTCSQGPYELEVQGSGAKWGEEFELRLHTPRNVALHAVILVDGKETSVIDEVFSTDGTIGHKPHNARCVASARERIVLGRTYPGTGTGTGTGTPGTLVVPPPDRARTTPQLDLDTSLVTTSFEVIKVSLRDRPPGTPPPRIRVRFWSIDPNDLEGVLFGIAHIEWRPNVSEEQYEAHLAWRAEQARLAEEARIERQRRAAEDSARADAEWRRTHPPQVVRPVVVKIDLEAEREAQRKRIEDMRKAEEARRRRAIAAALEAERRARRRQYCATHHEDRGCWGAGGYAVHAEFEQHDRERVQYCDVHPEDARCWSTEVRNRRTAAWKARITAALAPPKQPDGPPPAALVEDVPPKLSANAEWRAGYWQWTAGTWVWLAGMWRVPDEDIASEQTTTAPAAPPPLRTEPAPAAPVATAVWVPGFWQWGGTTWVWIAGSWQLRPEPRVQWRAAEWQPRGSVHVLIPGGWVRIGGRR